MDDNDKTVWWIIGLTVALGIYLRMDLYLLNRSLWLDEAFIAVNLTRRSMAELLLSPLDYSHYLVVPPGFLLMSKLLTAYLGATEYILRLLPLLCALLSLLIFYPMAVEYVPRKTAMLALLFFCVSDSHVEWASNVKQYSGDVLTAIVLWYLASRCRRRAASHRPILFLIAVGAITIWLSHPSVFVLTGIAVYWLIDSFRSGNRRRWSLTVLAIGTWIGSFLAFHYYVTRGFQPRQPIDVYLVELWRSWNGFMPFPLSPVGVRWLYDSYFRIFDIPGALAMMPLAAACFLFGVVSLYLTRKGTLFLLVSPALFTLLASYFEVYPFHDRLLLFLLPALYIPVAEGIMQLTIQLKALGSSRWLAPLMRVVIVFFLILTTPNDLRWTQEIKPVLQHIRSRLQAHDRLYLYYWAEPAFRFYDQAYGFNYEECRLISPIPSLALTKDVDHYRVSRGMVPVSPEETSCVLGVSELFSEARKDLVRLRGSGRVWFIFSHLDDAAKSEFLTFLDRLGQRLDFVEESGSSAYLYLL